MVFVNVIVTQLEIDLDYRLFTSMTDKIVFLTGLTKFD